MLDTMLARLSMTTSLLFGRPFSLWSLDRLVEAARETQREFGAVDQKEADPASGLSLDVETRRQVQLQRFRQQAGLGARETAYYADLFADLGLDPRRLEYDQITQIPLTMKQALRDRPETFVCKSADPYFSAMTTGTTGRPTRVYFSQHEIRTYSALQALSNLLDQTYDSEEVMINCTNPRGSIAHLCFTSACAAIGATFLSPGIIEPEQVLRLLSEAVRLPGKRSRPSVLITYPSYLGELFECGQRLGYRPQDFGLRQVVLGGEIVTEGLKRRAQRLFGPVSFREGYAMTETWPVEGKLCEQGHLHFEPPQGLVEVVEPETHRPALPGQVGVLVATPFPPFRETTLLLRYETQDMVRLLTGPLGCSLADRPATGHLLGKFKLSVNVQGNWIPPRSILEALEGIEEIPLPARFSFSGRLDGIALTVLARQDTSAMRSAIETALEENGVPLQELRLVEDRRDLQGAYPQRCDLREATFAPEKNIETKVGA